MDQLSLLRNLRAKSYLVVQYPTWCWNFQDPSVVECFYVWVEIRIGPDSRKLRGSDGIGPGCGLQINSITNRRFAAPVLADGAIVRDRYVINALMGFAILIKSTFDNLDTVEIRTNRIAQGYDHKVWPLTRSRFG